MGKRKSKGKKRKGKLAQAVAAHHKRVNPGEPEDDLRCLDCKMTRRSDIEHPEYCRRCGSLRYHERTAKYRCLNCGHEFLDFPGQPSAETVERRDDKFCPNPSCQLVTGGEHPGDLGERGLYVKWLNYEEWRSSEERAEEGSPRRSA